MCQAPASSGKALTRVRVQSVGEGCGPTPGWQVRALSSYPAQCRTPPVPVLQPPTQVGQGARPDRHPPACRPLWGACRGKWGLCHHRGQIPSSVLGA